MTTDPYDIELLRQTSAEQPPSAGDDAAVARHRYVLHALRQLPVPQAPTDFSRQMEASLRDHPEDARIEHWLLGIAVLAATVLAVAALTPWLAISTVSLSLASTSIPWRFLLAVAGGLALFASIDAARGRVEGR